MPTDATMETKFTLEGFLPWWGLVIAGLALFAASWWSSTRDQRFADRPGFIRALLVLRCITILVLLWMLAGPTLVTIMREYRTKSVAVLIDASASMGLVDVADGSGNVTRWAAAREKSRSVDLVARLDQSIATLRAGQNQLERFGKLATATKDPAAARALLAGAVKSIKAGLESVTSAANDLPPGAADISRGLSDAARDIAAKALDTLQTKSAEFNRGKTLASLDRPRWLNEQSLAVSFAVSQMERLADQFAKSVEEPEVKSPGEMTTRESKLSRFDKIDALLSSAEQTWLKDLRAKATVMRYEFGEKVVPLGHSPWEKTNGPAKALASATQLGAALQQVALDNTAQPVEAAILITDGGHNAGRDPRELAASLGAAALHIVPIGNTKMQRDVILHHTHAPKAVLQNDQVVIDSIVTAYACENEKLQIQLLENDRVIDQQTLTITGEVYDNRVQLRWKAAQLGKHTLGLRAIPVGDERSEENNASKADIHVMEDKIRVLVADNFPRWETRYLLNLFKRDDRVQFDQLLFEPQPSSGEGVRAGFPQSLDDWSKYQIIILGDLLPSQLTPSHQRMLRDHIVEGGGNLILVAGNDAMPGAYVNQPLGSLLPILPGARAFSPGQPFYLHLTDEGSMSLATQIADNPGTSERAWREMSERLPIYSLSEFSRPKPTTHSLVWASASKTSFNPADSSTRSFLAWHYVGAGRVVYLAAPVTYQLRYRQGDTFHHRFWGQLLRWTIARDLAEGSQTVRLSTDKSRYEHGESVQVTARMTQLDGRAVIGGTPQISALQNGQLLQAVVLKEDASRPGSYAALLEQLPAGPVTLQLSGSEITTLLAAENYRRPIETTIHIDPSGMVELRHPLCNLSLLREIADSAGGMLIPATGLSAAVQQLNLDPEVLETVSKKPLWNRWDLFALFIGCLTLEWIGRKYVGLS